MASARRTGTNENISTYGNGTRDYTSLSTWEAATDYDLVTATTSEVLECYRDSASYNDNLDAVGATGSSSYFRIVRAAPGEEHGGVFGAGVKFTNTANQSLFNVEEDFFKVYDLELETTLNTASTRAAIQLEADEAICVGILVTSATNAGAGGAIGIELPSAPNGAGAVDCIVKDCKTAAYLAANTLFTGFAYNCTAVNSTVGFAAGTGGTFVVKNCLADNNTTDYTGTFNAASEANTSSDATVPGSAGLSTVTTTFVDGAGDDYHLAASDTGALQRGLDLSADSTFAFDDDIDGDTVVVWSIGADAQASFNSSRRRAVGENVSTYGNGTRDYTSLSTWEAATDNDLVTATTSEVLECYADSASFDDRITLAGATTSADYFRIIRPAAGQAHDGTPTSGVVFISTANNHGFAVSEANVHIQDIACSVTGATTGTRGVFLGQTVAGARFVGCLAFDSPSGGSSTMHGFQLSEPGGSNAVAVDCLAHNVGANGFNATGGVILVFNCTATNCTVGFNGAVGDGVWKNCLASGNTTDFAGPGTAGQTNNASSDATAPGTSNRINQTFTFVNAGSDDYHLTTTDGGAKGFGTDLSADATFPFDDDIDGAAITTWSIGFDSDPTVTPASVGSMLFFRRRRR